MEKTEPYIRTDITGFLEYTRQIKDSTTFISSLTYSLDLLDRDGDGTITISDRGVTDVTNYSEQCRQQNSVAVPDEGCESKAGFIVPEDC